MAGLESISHNQNLHRFRFARLMARAIPAAICPWLARNELGSGSLKLVRDALRQQSAPQKSLTTMR